MKRLIVCLVALPLLAACSAGSTDNPTSLNAPGTPSAAPAGPGLVTSPPAAAGTSCASAAPVAPAPAGSTTDLTQKPAVPRPAGAAPCGLQVMDVVVGQGAAAAAGQKLSMKYVGVLYADGSEFDSSWKRGKDQTFDFTLGAQQVIAGWDQGLVGMKVGGRRELVIPPALGYGPQGSPPVIPPNAPLIFVVDLVKLG